jgi:hypothetical protein
MRRIRCSTSRNESCHCWRIARSLAPIAHHLPVLFRDLILRLRSDQSIGTKALTPTGAAEHGANRFKQGYTAAMLVEESRMLQVSIFETLQKNLAFIDYTVVLLGVMTIANEVDSQLSQAMRRFSVESLSEARAAGA